MQAHRLRAGFLAALAAPLLPAAADAQGTPAAPGIRLELNKLEAAGDGCRAYFVAENGTADPIREIRLDTFIFNGGGVIARRILLSFPDLRPGRAKVVPFDLAGAPCDDLGKLLVNDVLACTSPAGAPVAGCADRLTTSSRTKTPLAY